jgi:hypothetical protein
MEGLEGMGEFVFSALCSLLTYNFIVERANAIFTQDGPEVLVTIDLRDL